MGEVELHVAEVYLDGLVERVERGETVTTTRDGVPVAAHPALMRKPERLRLAPTARSVMR